MHFKYVFISFLTLSSNINLNGMQDPQGKNKRSWDHKSLLEQMAQKRHKKDREVIAKAEKMGEKRTDDLHQWERKFIYDTLGKLKYTPILTALCSSPLFKDETGQQLKNQLLFYGVAMKRIEPENAALLLLHGAKSDYQPLSTEPLLLHGVKSDYHPYDLMNNSTYEIILNRPDWGTNEKLLHTFMSFDTGAAFQAECNYLLSNCSKEEANVFLYHGCATPKDVHPFHPKFFEHAHARRVFRMAHFLSGWVQLPLPVELCLIIAEHRYGKLSQRDRELMYTYEPNDYMVQPKE